MSGSRSVGGDMMMAMGETSTRSDGTKGEREKERKKEREREREREGKNAGGRRFVD
jgi:hypothetical protein